MEKGRRNPGLLAALRGTEPRQSSGPRGWRHPEEVGALRLLALPVKLLTSYAPGSAARLTGVKAGGGVRGIAQSEQTLGPSTQ